MTEFEVGDRVRVVRDLIGLSSFLGREGVVTLEAKFREGVLAADPLVRLSGEPLVLRDLRFAPEELELIARPVPDHAAEAADAARDMDRADRLIGGAQ